nr:2-oxo acid dehydrogenase subunit E2 [Sphingobium sp. YR768]
MGASIETKGYGQVRACPRVNEHGFMWRSCLPLSLSYDHRVINGADAARLALAVRAHINGIKFTSIGRPAAGRGLSSSEHRCCRHHSLCPALHK